MKAMITRKLGMTSIIDDQGAMIGVTLLAASPNKVMQVKTEETDGYCGLQLGFETNSKANKPQADQAKQLKLDAPKVRREIRLDQLPEGVKAGDSLEVSVFAKGDVVKVTASSKGKGFAGAIKRHNFHSQSKTHGAKGAIRRLGSIGSMYPQKVYKGRKMPGRLGAAQTTTLNLKIALVDEKQQVLGVLGSIPGPRRGLVIVRGQV